MRKDTRERRGDYLIALARKYGWQRGAELGVWYGQTYFRMLSHMPELTLIGVDKWMPEYHDFAHHKNQTENRAEVYRNKGAFGDRAVIMEMDMTEAARQIPDGSLDFIFIDGDHSYEGCRNDILTWLPKIKETGWITGHDFNFPGVNQAVRELLELVACPDFDDTWARPVNIPKWATTVCCLKQGKLYGPAYVNILYRMVQRNVYLEPYDFVCFTDDATGIDPWIRTAPLPWDAPGWWGKMGLYQESIPGVNTDRILFFDLDVVITGNIDPLLWRRKEFRMAVDYPRGSLPANDMRLKHGNSSVICLDVGSQKEIWDAYVAGGKPQIAGDQDWVNGNFPGRFSLIDEGLVKSYKMNNLNGGVPDGCSVVIFHGRPKPHECGGWVRNYWK